MKRNLKNIVIILIIIAVGVCSYFTMKNTQTTNSDGSINQQKGQMPPQMPSQNSSDSNSNNNMEEPPEKPNGGNNSNSSNNQNSGNQNGEPSTKPSEGNGSNSSNKQNSRSQMSEPPAKPDGENNSNNNELEPKEMPNMNQQNSEGGIQTIHYIMFGIEGLVISILIIYLAMSRFNKYTLRETLNETNITIIFVLLTLILTTILTVAQVCITNKLFTTINSSSQNSQQMIPEGNTSSASTSVTKSGETEVDGINETLTANYTTSENDKSVILVKNDGNLTLDGAEVSKTGGDSSNTENSEFYGVNAGILVTENSTATIKSATIDTNAKGSNAVFSTGTDSKIYISDSTITTTGSSSSRGLDATYGGYIEADNVKITTQGGSCATDRGEGTVIAKNSKLETNGSGSPVIYSTGDISITNTEGTANGSQMVVIEGKNTATVTSSTLTASAQGNRGDTDQAGIMIYQSMSGDAGEGTGTFTVKNSSLSIQNDSKYYKTAPMFFITNTDAVINLDNCKLSYGSNTLISCKGTSEWGKSGSNGGNVTLNAENQVLDGNIEIDNISTLTMNLSSSSYSGTINADNTAKNIALKLDTNSTITLTGDSYVASLDDSDSSYDNINFNGYKLYVNGIAIN